MPHPVLRPLCLIILAISASAMTCGSALADPFEDTLRPILSEHCLKCHGGEKVKGKVDFSQIKTRADVEEHFELWELVAELVASGDMPPPDDEDPLPADKKAAVEKWITELRAAPVEARPAPFRPRRLSAPEYRNTLHSLFGFELKVTIAKAEQTATGTDSLVIKLLPPDPPGPSGFANDTHAAPLSTTLWEQYSQLSSTAIEGLFTPGNRPQLSRMIGRKLSKKWKPADLTEKDATALLRHFLPRAQRRLIEEKDLAPILKSLEGKSGPELVAATKFELQAILMSPSFLYRGLLVQGEPGTQSEVDSFEYAERLSYFLWGDRPDDELTQLAAEGKLPGDKALVASQITRMLASPKSRYLSDQFGVEWLALGSIDDTHQRDPIRQQALRSQPRDFLHYLFTEQRPIMELIDSRVAFANDNTAGMYGKDRSQMKRIPKPKGIERWATPNQRIQLKEAEGRGGILTMPAVLTMNRGPILRGTWMLERILGEHLGDPPADVPPVKASPKGQNLTFRERFEAHRENTSCARCHEKIDPLGFALDGYDGNGVFLLHSKRPPLKPGQKPIDTSGQLPSGERFANFAELKQILLTSEKESIVHNAVEQTLAFALCRPLRRSDQPVVEEITKKMLQSNGTWESLFTETVLSLPFREAVFPAK